MDNTRLPPKRSKTFSGHDTSQSSSSTPLSYGGRLRHSTGDIASKDVANDLRRSTLIPENATNDANWFAKRGLMSRKSFKLHKKELKKKSKKDKKKNKKNTSRDDNGGIAEFSQSLNDIESSYSPSNKNRLLHNSMESLEEEEVDIFSKSLDNTTSDMMMFSKSRQNDSATSLVSEDFRESVDSFRRSLDSGSGSGGSPPLSGGSEQSMPPSLATTDESGDKMSSPPRRRLGVISGDKDDLTLLSSRMRREEHDDESCENERAPSDSIDISGFRENMISNLDMEYTASSRTLQALQDQKDSNRNGSNKTKMAMKKQVSWKTDQLEVPKRTSYTTVGGVSDIIDEEEVEYARNTVRESVATQITGNLTAPQRIVVDGDDDDDDSLSLNGDILSNTKSPPPPPNDSSSLAILKGGFIQISDTYDQRRPSLEVSALDMGFSSKTLQNKWLNNELSYIEDSNRSSDPDDDDNSVNRPVSIQLHNDVLGPCLSSSLDIDSMDSEGDDADSSSSDTNEECADNIVPETHFDRKISDNSGGSKSILHSGKEPCDLADRRHSTVSFCDTTKSANFSTIDVTTTVTGVSDLTPNTDTDTRKRGSAGSTSFETAKTSDKHEKLELSRSCPPSFEVAENSARVKERRTSTLIPKSHRSTSLGLPRTDA